jgi:hypothetical protein
LDNRKHRRNEFLYPPTFNNPPTVNNPLLVMATIAGEYAATDMIATNDTIAMKI